MNYQYYNLKIVSKFNCNCFYISLISLVLFSSCAQIVNPTGGARDITPPKITKTIPLNKSININLKSDIKLSFNEFIELSNPNEKVLISPPLKESPTYKVSGKTISISISDTLKANTTYTLFFDNCIRDITESNAIPALEYVFSTGSSIDSGVIKGSVFNAFTLKPESQICVMLYRENIDSLPLTTKPYYLSKSNDQGVFLFSHVSYGSYKLFALADKNNNLIFDQFSEKIGFTSIPVNTIDTTLFINIALFDQVDTLQKVLKKSVIERGKILITFKKDAKKSKFTLKGSDFNQRFIQEFNANGDSIFLYDKLSIPDTVTIYLDDDNLKDTITLAPSIERKVSKKMGNSKSKIGIVLLNSRDLFKSIQILTDEPIKSIDTSRIKLFLIDNDTTLINYTISSEDIIGKKYNLLFNKLPQKSYFMLISDSTVYGYNHLSNDSIKQTFTVLSEDDYGNLIIHVDNKNNKPLIVQLFNERSELVSSQLTSSSKIDVKWANLLPGAYQIKAIVDENQNKQWDSGDYFKKLLPEKIVIFATPIQIRAKWDIEEKFVVD